MAFMMIEALNEILFDPREKIMQIGSWIRAYMFESNIPGKWRTCLSSVLAVFHASIWNTNADKNATQTKPRVTQNVVVNPRSKQNIRTIASAKHKPQIMMPSFLLLIDQPSLLVPHLGQNFPGLSKTYPQLLHLFGWGIGCPQESQNAIPGMIFAPHSSQN